ncbi:MAG: hypothetical protein WAV46_00095 [Candidatus Moraniibacteriota bacterium]
MYSNIRFGRIGIIFIALVGIAILLFLIGKQSIEIVACVPLSGIEPPASRVASPAPRPESVTDPNIYRNDTYGFGTIFLTKVEAATECPLEARMAYDPIKEYVFADQPIECAPDADNSERFYNERGGQLETMVFDLTKCHDAVKDQIEERFCTKYDTVGVTSGQSTGKWPTGTWTKSGDYITFYLDLTFGKNEHWKSDYKFLVLER